jgi:hypothetical protein
MPRMLMRPLTGFMLGLCVLAGPVMGQQQKLAQTGLKFLSTSLDPRAAAMGDAVTAVDGGSEMMFYNPAGMASQSTFLNVSFGQLQWIADINYDQVSLSFAPRNGRFGVIGISVVSVDYGELQGTIRADNDQGFLETEIFSPSATAIGVAYARALTNRFSVGGQIKFAHQNLGSNVQELDENGGFVTAANRINVTAFDFGVLYRTGFRSMTFAFSARNFSEEVKYVDESFQLPLTMKIGLAMDVLDLTRDENDKTHSLLVSIDAENPRDFSEQLKIGTEYVFLEAFSLRAGYAFPTDEQGLNLGAGVFRRVGGVGIGADYAYTDFGVFSKVHRFALRLSL